MGKAAYQEASFDSPQAGGAEGDPGRINLGNTIVDDGGVDDIPADPAEAELYLRMTPAVFGGRDSDGTQDEEPEGYVRYKIDSIGRRYNVDECGY